MERELLGPLPSLRPSIGRTMTRKVDRLSLASPVWGAQSAQRSPMGSNRRVSPSVIRECRKFVVFVAPVRVRSVTASCSICRGSWPASSGPAQHAGKRRGVVLGGDRGPLVG